MDDFIGFGNFARFLSDDEERWKIMGDLSVALIRNKEAESNVDPIQRINAESLVRVAQLNIFEIVDLDVASVKLVPTTRENLARDTLKSYRPFFEALEKSYSQELAGIAPLLSVIIVAGGVGNLALGSLSSYGVLAPRYGNPKEVLVAASNVEEFIENWSLPSEDFWMWVCLSELAKHTIISIPHIHSEFVSLTNEFCTSFEPASYEMLEKLTEQLSLTSGDLQNIGDIESQLMGLASTEPELLMGIQISEVQESIFQQLSTLVALIGGLSQYIVDSGAEKIFGDNLNLGQIKEAVYRRESSVSPAVNLISRLLGIDMSVELKSLGQDFVQGVIQISGKDAVYRLLESVETLPTAAELEAPGLWLARTGYQA